MHFKNRHSYLLALKETQTQIHNLRCGICKTLDLEPYWTNSEHVLCSNCSKRLRDLPEYEVDLKLPVKVKSVYNLHKKLLGEWTMVIKPKLNGRGETPLHVACKAKKLEDVLNLIEIGENVNAIDHAGWLPLHDAVNNGCEDIVVALLKAGSFVNVPGLNYDSPVYTAIVNNQMDIAGWLLGYGANMSMKNFDGIRPIDLIDFQPTPASSMLEQQMKTFEIRDLEYKYGPTKVFIDDDRILPIVEKLVEENYQFKYTKHNWIEVSHIVIYESVVDACNPHALRGIIRGVPVVTVEWLNKCAEIGYCAPVEPFLVQVSHSLTNNAILKSLENRKKLLPPLFDKIHFYFTGMKETSDFDIKVGNSVLPGKWLRVFIEEGGGHMLKREPSEGSLQDVAKHYPWHADESSGMENCCNFILYNKPRELKYNMPELKHVPAVWLLECIWKFRLVPISQLELEQTC